MNYIKQKDTHSCGPIALINAQIFQGKPHHSLELMSLSCNCEFPHGTKIKDFSNVAKKLKYTRVYRPTIEKLNDILDRDYAVIINHGDKRRHYSLIISRTNNAYNIVNHYCGATITPIKKAKFESDVWRDPKLWLVKSPKNL